MLLKLQSHNKIILALAVIFLFLCINISLLIHKDVSVNQSKDKLPTDENSVLANSTTTSENNLDSANSSTTEESLMVNDGETNTSPTPISSKPLLNFIQVTDGCETHFQGECLLVRSGPSKDYPVVYKLRNGVVLKTSESVTDDSGITWYKIVFDEWLRYPERVGKSWYVAANYVKVIPDVGELTVPGDMSQASNTKEILVDRSDQKLYAYENGQIFMVATTSTGLKSTPTPRGIFTIYKKTPSRYMQGPLPGVSDQYYDLPGVPWNLYFSEQGAVIHGAYWHNSFGTPFSHGCVNLSIEDAYKLYNWAELGTKVTVRD